MDGLFLTSRRHWWERVNNTVIEFNLTMTSGSSQERTRAARLIERDANDCAISPPPVVVVVVVVVAAAASAAAAVAAAHVSSRQV